MGRARTKNKHLPPRMQLKRGRFYYTPYVGGKVVWKALGDDYVQALMRWKELEGLNDGAETVHQLLERALGVLVDEVKPSTFREFTRAMNNLKGAFEGFRPEDVEHRHLVTYLSNRSAKVSANREIGFFSTAWSKAREKGWINLPNPADGIKKNKERKRKRVASAEEIKALLGLDEPLTDMVELTLMTAMRESDMLNLTVRNLRDEGIWIKPRKTDTSTQAEILYPWTSELRSVLDKAKGRRKRVGSLFLFPVKCRGRAGQAYTVNSFQNVWRRYFERCKVEGLTWHDLRRTALNMRKEEGGTEAAKDMAGHSSITTTEGYMKAVGLVRVAPNRVRF